MAEPIRVVEQSMKIDQFSAQTSVEDLWTQLDSTPVPADAGAAASAGIVPDQRSQYPGWQHTVLAPDIDAQVRKAELTKSSAASGQPLSIKVDADLSAARSTFTGLHKPKPEVLAELKKMLDGAKKAAASGDEDGRKAVDKVLQKVAEAYGINQQGVTGLEFDPKREHLGDTIGKNPRTFIVVGKEALNSPEELASVIFHESSHVARNIELAKKGIDRDKFSDGAEATYSDLIEAEAYQNEIDNASKLGTPKAFVDGARAGRDRYLKDLGAMRGEAWQTLAEQGKFDQLQERFRSEQLKKQSQP